MRNEDPSPEDIERFGDDADQTGWCPECGNEVWDETESCPACGAYIRGRVLRRPPDAENFHRRMLMLIGLVALIAFVFGFVI